MNVSLRHREFLIVFVCAALLSSSCSRTEPAGYDTVHSKLSSLLNDLDLSDEAKDEILKRHRAVVTTIDRVAKSEQALVRVISAISMNATFGIWKDLDRHAKLVSMERRRYEECVNRIVYGIALDRVSIERIEQIFQPLNHGTGRYKTIAELRQADIDEYYRRLESEVARMPTHRLGWSWKDLFLDNFDRIETGQ